MAASGIEVKGFREMRRNLRSADKDLDKGLRKSLRAAAEPVRRDAESLAESRITNIGPVWGRMRTGVTQSMVYVAPRQRGRRGRLKRPNLAGLLEDRAMQPALDANEDDIEREIGDMLDGLVRRWVR